MLDGYLHAISYFLVPGMPYGPDGYTLNLLPSIPPASKNNEGEVGSDNRKGCMEGNKEKTTDQGQYKVDGQAKQSSHKPETNFE